MALAAQRRHNASRSNKNTQANKTNGTCAGTKVEYTPLCKARAP